MNLEYIHTGLSLAVLSVTVLLTFIGLKIKEAQAANREATLKAIATVREEQVRVKDELKSSQNEMRADMNEMRADMDEKHAENRQTIAVHIVSDEQQFRTIGSSLAEIKDVLKALAPRRRS